MAIWLKRWHHRQVKMRRSMRGGVVHRVLGERLFHPHVWKMDLASVAGGVSLGLFVAFTPTIPFHMLLCAVGAILLRVNLPVAVAVSWVTNPVTAVPIYFADAWLGHHLLGDTHLAEYVLSLFRFESRTGKLMMEGVYVWAGAIPFATLAAVLGNLAVRTAWRLMGRRNPEPLDRPPPDIGA